jgi:N-hydroxyarylamine O-acetyltransferase
MRLLVHLGGSTYVADTGLGAITLPEPLVLEPEVEQRTSLDARRLVPVGEELLEQVNFGAGWADVCVFRPVGVPAPDFELGNWYYCTHPQSLFVRNLVVALPGADHRRSLFNHEFVTRWVDGRTERETIGSESRMRAVLSDHFGIKLSPHARLACEGLAWPG